MPKENSQDKSKPQVPPETPQMRGARKLVNTRNALAARDGTVNADDPQSTSEKVAARLIEVRKALRAPEVHAQKLRELEQVNAQIQQELARARQLSEPVSPRNHIDRRTALRLFVYGGIAAAAWWNRIPIAGVIVDTAKSLGKPGRITISSADPDRRSITVDSDTLWPYSESEWPEGIVVDVESIRNRTDQGLTVLGPPTIDSELITDVLSEYKSERFPNGSPALAAGGQVWIDLGKKYRIDPAFALAFFIHESGAGTNPGWDGITMDTTGLTSRSIGNIACTPDWKAQGKRCAGSWRAYDSWEEGIEDWYKLILFEYVADTSPQTPAGRGLSTIEEIIPVYASSKKDNASHYIDSVYTHVHGFKEKMKNRSVN